jgi:hypothetical protein
MQNNKPIEINKECQFMHDLTNNAQMARYNLIVVTGQLKLYSKGIKPSRHFRLKDIKHYFGITGNLESITNKIDVINGVVEEVVKGVKVNGTVIKDNINLSNKGGSND